MTHTLSNDMQHVIFRNIYWRHVCYLQISFVFQEMKIWIGNTRGNIYAAILYVIYKCSSMERICLIAHLMMLLR